MDGFKLAQWRETFNNATENLEIEFDSFFKNKKLDSFYRLRLDERSENLCLVITDETLPREIEDKLTKLFMETKPEDSV